MGALPSLNDFGVKRKHGLTWEGQRLGLSPGTLSRLPVLGTAQKHQPSCPLG